MCPVVQVRVLLPHRLPLVAAKGRARLVRVRPCPSVSVRVRPCPSKHQHFPSIRTVLLEPLSLAHQKIRSTPIPPTPYNFCPAPKPPLSRTFPCRVYRGRTPNRPLPRIFTHGHQTAELTASSPVSGPASVSPSRSGSPSSPPHPPLPSVPFRKFRGSCPRSTPLQPRKSPLPPYVPLVPLVPYVLSHQAWIFPQKALKPRKSMVRFSSNNVH